MKSGSIVRTYVLVRNNNFLLFLLNCVEFLCPHGLPDWTAYSLTISTFTISPRRKVSWAPFVNIIQNFQGTLSVDHLSTSCPPYFNSLITITSPVSCLLDGPFPNRRLLTSSSIPLFIWAAILLISRARSVAAASQKFCCVWGHFLMISNRPEKSGYSIYSTVWIMSSSSD